MWTCPVCRQALLPAQARSLACSSGHHYDRAKEGYVNLLLANRKHSQEPGDSKEMIAARRRVHDAGPYQALADAIKEQLSGLSRSPESMLDMGCGEGFYSAAIASALPKAEVWGVDIAKPAVKLAAKRHPQVHFAVASVFDIPLPDASVDFAASIFAPVELPELTRLLQPGGIYLKVTPAPDHLSALRCLLYDDPRPHQALSQRLDGFETINESDVSYSLDVSGKLLRDIAAMTPYAHRGQRENRAKLEAAEGLQLEMCFSVSVQCYREG